MADLPEGYSDYTPPTTVPEGYVAYDAPQKVPMMVPANNEVGFAPGERDERPIEQAARLHDVDLSGAPSGAREVFDKGINHPDYHAANMQNALGREFSNTLNQRRDKQGIEMRGPDTSPTAEYEFKNPDTSKWTTFFDHRDNLLSASGFGALKSDVLSTAVPTAIGTMAGAAVGASPVGSIIGGAGVGSSVGQIVDEKVLPSWLGDHWAGKVAGSAVGGTTGLLFPEIGATTGGAFGGGIGNALGEFGKMYYGQKVLGLNPDASVGEMALTAAKTIPLNVAAGLTIGTIASGLRSAVKSATGTGTAAEYEAADKAAKTVYDNLQSRIAKSGGADAVDAAKSAASGAADTATAGAADSKALPTALDALKSSIAAPTPYQPPTSILDRLQPRDILANKKQLAKTTDIVSNAQDAFNDAVTSKSNSVVTSARSRLADIVSGLTPTQADEVSQHIFNTVAGNAKNDLDIAMRYKTVIDGLPPKVGAMVRASRVGQSVDQELTSVLGQKTASDAAIQQYTAATAKTATPEIDKIIADYSTRNADPNGFMSTVLDNTKASQQVADRIAGDAASSDAVLGQIKSLYIRDVIKNGVVDPAAHAKFMENYGDSLKNFLSLSQKAQMSGASDASKVIGNIQDKRAAASTAVKNAFSDAAENPDNVTTAMTVLKATDPEYAKQLQREFMREKMPWFNGSSATPDVKEIANFMANKEQKGTVARVMGQQYADDLENFATAATTANDREAASFIPIVKALKHAFSGQGYANLKKLIGDVRMNPQKISDAYSKVLSDPVLLHSLRGAGKPSEAFRSALITAGNSGINALRRPDEASPMLPE